MANFSAEVQFAQNLASNEKKIRDKALKKLKKYLRLKSSSKDGFTEEDFLKLWKGLHYCLWMQDKPLIQEELSETLSKLVHDLDTKEAQILFLQTFFVTEAREWNSIDIWRIDKFMMLMRCLLHELMVRAKKVNWDDSYISSLIQVISKAGLDHNNDSIPDGMQTHLADIYLDEIFKVTDEKLDGRVLVKLLEPFSTFILKAKNTFIVKRVIARVFEPIILRAVELKVQEKQGTEEKKFIKYRDIKFDNSLLADHLFELAVGDGCLTRNRPFIYDIVKRLRNAEEGVLPRKPKIGRKTGITNEDINEAIHSLEKLQKMEMKKNKKKQKKKKSSDGKENVDSNNNADESEESSTEADSEETETNSTDPQRKRKHDLETSTDSNSSPNKIKKKQSVKNTEVNQDKVDTENTDSDSSPIKIKKKQSVKNTEVNPDKVDTENTIDTEDIEGEGAGVDKSLGKNKNDKTSGNKKCDDQKHSPRKRKSSHGLHANSTPQRIGTDESDGFDAGESSSKVTKGGSAKKRKKSGESDTPKHNKKKEFKTVIHVGKSTEKEKKKSVWKVTPIINHETKTVTDSVEASTDKSEIKLSKDAPAKGQKDSSAQRKTTEAELENNKSESVTKEGKGQSSNKTTDKQTAIISSHITKESESSKGKSTMSDDLEGDIEIWIPNKKYKGKQSSVTPFAQFEKTKQPVAFVRKAMSKVKKQSPKPSVNQSNQSETEAATSAKKVKFDMKKNKALAFKDSLNISPVFPFHPDKKPDQGILKSTPEGGQGTPQQTLKPVQSLFLKQGGSSSSAKGVLRGQHGRGVKSGTPVSALTLQHKKKPVMKLVKRAKAADFFSS